MSETDLTGLLHLLKRVNLSGIKVAFENEELSLKLLKGRKIDPVLLNDLRENKDRLIGYFKNRTLAIESAEMTLSADRLEYNGESYFEITTTQLYWVDKHIDEEYKLNDRIHGTILRAWQIDGDFDLNAFKKAVAFLIARHESLRATFHNINGTYRMKIGEITSPVYRPEFIDRCGQDLENELIIKELTRFEGYAFDLEKGPLFLVRVIRIENEKWLVSVKIHHVISDTLSILVLQRELFIAYKNICEGRLPALPPLKFQYKEYLFFINSFSKRNQEADRKYWSGLFNDLPGELIIPGIVRTNFLLTRKTYRAERSFHFTDEMADKLSSLAGEFSTSLFVIIQSTFKAFLAHHTGQNDILIGTYIFGRQYGGCEDQIGCYAKTALIRTILDRQDSFYEAIRKVKKSNDDMRDYQALPLKDFLEEKLPPGHPAGTAFWNINLQFSEAKKIPEPPTKNSPGTNQMPPKGGEITHIHIPGHVNTLMALDMQLKFLHRHKDLSVEVQYDGSLYDPAIIRNFMSAYLKYTGEIL